jgi:hypothetical protein
MGFVAQKALDASIHPGERCHGVLEMPTGTGKTVCLLSLITSYQLAHEDTGKLIYCTRTVPEMTKCMEELRHVHEYQRKALAEDAAAAAGAAAGAPVIVAASRPFLAVCLSARRNMCINEEVMASEAEGKSVDVECRKRTVCVCLRTSFFSLDAVVWCSWDWLLLLRTSSALPLPSASAFTTRIACSGLTNFAPVLCIVFVSVIVIVNVNRGCMPSLHRRRRWSGHGKQASQTHQHELASSLIILICTYRPSNT